MTMNKNGYVLWMSAFFLLAILLPACHQNESEFPIDNSFITGIPCSAPCWYDLELEHSSYDDAENLLKALPFINQERIWERENDRGYFLEFSCVNSGLDLCGSLFFDTERKLLGISNRQYSNITISQMIEKLGIPSGFKMGDYHVGCVFEVYWLSLNIRAETIITPDQFNKCDKIEGGDIDEDFIIEWLIYSTFQPPEEELISWP